MSQLDRAQQHLETLSEIRQLMDQSARFLSLSGLTGVWAGACALVGAAAAWAWLGMAPLSASAFEYYEKAAQTVNWGLGHRAFFLLDGLAVLAAALAGGWFFSARKARRDGQSIWGAASRRMALSLFLPLATGFAFCLLLEQRGDLALVAPSTLVFYGLALVAASRDTLRDVFWLGLLEIALGLFGMWRPGFGLELWAVGFGALHIGYGAFMHAKYDARPRR